MKKCYVIPNVKVTTIEIASMVCQSPFTGGQIDDPVDAPVAGGDVDMESRQRGGDFGSLW